MNDMSIATPRIAFDISALDPNFKAHAQRGIGRYVSELVKYFSNEQYPVQRFDHNSLPARSPFLKSIDWISRVSPLGRNTLRQQFLYPLKLGRADFSAVEAIHFPAHMDAPMWSKRPCIVTVLDLIPHVLSDLYKADRSPWRYRLARGLEIRAIRNAKLILAISKCTAKDIENILGIPGERIVVTPLGVGEEFFRQQILDEASIRARYNIPCGRKIILYVGGIDPRKNINVMFEAFSIVCAKERESGAIPPVLLLSGRIQEDREYPKLISRITELSLQKDVITPGYIREEDLLSLYAISAVFFFPSLYEGFGLPPLEAMAAGTPVVSSNSSSLPEVLGDAALLVAPSDVQGFAEALYGVLKNPDLRSRLSACGRKQAQHFSWAKTGQATINAYRSLSQRGVH